MEDDLKDFFVFHKTGGRKFVVHQIKNGQPSFIHKPLKEGLDLARRLTVSLHLEPVFVVSHTKMTVSVTFNTS